MNTRTPFLTPEQMDPTQRRVYEDIIRTRGTWLNGPYAPLLHSPELADKAQAFGELVRYRTSLAPRWSELAILVTARHWDCQFEWLQHEKIARREGITAATCNAIAGGTAPPFSDEHEAVIHAFASQLLDRHLVEDSTYARARELFGVRGVVELVAVIGYYSFIAMTLNAHEVPLPAGTPRPLPARCDLLKDSNAK
jgi:4-carboxymuconolactone decarboxylase